MSRVIHWWEKLADISTPEVVAEGGSLAFANQVILIDVEGLTSFFEAPQVSVGGSFFDFEGLIVVEDKINFSSGGGVIAETAIKGKLVAHRIFKLTAAGELGIDAGDTSVDKVRFGQVSQLYICGSSVYGNQANEIGLLQELDVVGEGGAIESGYFG